MSEDNGYNIEPAKADDDEPETYDVQAAFVVFIRPDGKAIATPEYELVRTRVAQDGPYVELRATREATFEDMRRAMLEALEDLRTIIVSNATVSLQMQAAQQQMRAMQQQQEAQQLAKHLDLGNIRR